MTQVAEVSTTAHRGGFHRLAVEAVEAVADDAVAVTFAVPPELAWRFRFQAGQHLTLRAHLAGIEVRRTYSICARADLGPLRVGVRRLRGGLLSSYIHDQLQPGDQLEVMEPAGHFTIPLDASARREYFAVAAGSGITPILSLLSTALAVETHSRATLLYGNRTVGATMFLDELADLKDRYPDRLQLFFSFSRERQEVELQNGRLDGPRVMDLVSRLVLPATVDRWLLCGPHGMTEEVSCGLSQLLVPPERVQRELFFVEDTPPTRTREEEELLTRPGDVTVTARLDSRETTFVSPRSRSLVDGLATVRADAPFSCKGGVCGTCRARLLEGRVAMDHTYALEPAERDQGFILTCQAHPLTDRIVVDYDA